MCIVQRVKLSLPVCHGWDTTSSQSPAVHRLDSPYSHPGERKEYIDSQQSAETPPVPMSESDQPPRLPEPGDLPAQECSPYRSDPGKESGHETTREPSIRTEFGVARASCACKECSFFCKVMPGRLIPADLARLIPPGADPFAWAREHLRATSSTMGRLSVAPGECGALEDSPRG
jgi:hypothetical protein